MKLLEARAGADELDLVRLGAGLPAASGATARSSRTSSPRTACSSRSCSEQPSDTPFEIFEGENLYRYAAVVTDRTIGAGTARARWTVAYPALRASALPFLVSRAIVLLALARRPLRRQQSSPGLGRGAERSPCRPARLGRELVRADRPARVRGARARGAAFLPVAARAGESAPRGAGRVGGRLGDRRREPGVPGGSRRALPPRHVRAGRRGVCTAGCVDSGAGAAGLRAGHGLRRVAPAADLAGGVSRLPGATLRTCDLAGRFSPALSGHRASAGYPAAIEVVAELAVGVAPRARSLGVGTVLAAPAGAAAYLGWAQVTAGNFDLPLSEQLSHPHRGRIADPFVTVCARRRRSGARSASRQRAARAVGGPARAARRLPGLEAARLPTAGTRWRRSPSRSSSANLDSLERYALGCFPFAIAAAMLTRSRSIFWAVISLSGALLLAYALLAFLGAYVP